MTGSLARRLAVALTVGIVIVDIVLIGAAVRGTTGSRAAAPATILRTGSPAYPAPEMIAPTRPGASMRTVPVPAPRATPADAPTIEVLGESRSVGEEPAPVSRVAPAAGAAPPTAVAPPRGDESATSRLLLAISPDGTVIRATRGSCPADGGATIELSADFGRTWFTLASTVAQVLRVDATGGGNLRVVATDLSCRPVASRSADGGAGWQPDGLSGVWYLSPDSDADQVLGPGLVSSVGCVPRSLSAPDDDRAAVSCADGTVRVTSDGGDHWRNVPGLSGVTSVAFTAAGGGFALASVDGCAAAVLRAAGQMTGWRATACLDALAGSATAAGGVPPQMAIAASGTVVAAQLGTVFTLSTDSGANWTAAAG